MILETGKNKGFSIIELMVTVVIVSITLLFILRAYGTCADYIVSAQNRTQAVFILRELLEGLREDEIAGKDITKSSKSGEVKKGQIVFRWAKKISRWWIPCDGAFSGLVSLGDQEHEQEAQHSDEVVLVPARKEIACVGFRVDWNSKAKNNDIKLDTLVRMEHSSE